jgi:hypothetical protein
MAKSKSLASVTIGEPDIRLSASPISPVPDDFVGQRVKIINHFGTNGMGFKPRPQHPAQFLGIDRSAGENLGSGDEHAHDALLAVAGRMVRLPSPSTVAVVPPGTTTVVVGTSTIAGPVSTCPARSWR